jgi:N-acetylglucosamine-6-phosphate deacetylase
MISATPARILGVQDKKGTLAVGKDADILIFDKNIQISMTMINGNIVYQKQ